MKIGFVVACALALGCGGQKKGDGPDGGKAEVKGEGDKNVFGTSMPKGGGGKGGGGGGGGGGGFFALSPDGKSWSDLPRFTNDQLWAVAVGQGSVVAVGKSGSFVKTSASGGEPVVGMLPDKMKAGSVSVDKLGIVVAAGK